MAAEGDTAVDKGKEPAVVCDDAEDDLAQLESKFPGMMRPEDMLNMLDAADGSSDMKLRHVSPDEAQLQDLIKELNFRLTEGGGEYIYDLGVTRDDTPEGLTPEQLAASVETLNRMAAANNADVTVLREKDTPGGKVADLLVRRKPTEEFKELRVAVVGNVDSGKSTLLGVLTRGVLDDGRGRARSNIFRHKHEQESGRTSSISQEIMGFDSKGDIVNYTGGERAPSWSQICKDSSKVITFIDLAGHEKYLKTTLFGLTGHAPDFCMMSVGANMGIVGMTKEHLGIALALKVPVFVVLTKIDMCPKNVLKRTIMQLTKLIKSPGARKVPFNVKSMDDVVVAARSFLSDRICPVFLVSNVSGDNLDNLRAFLNLLPSRTEWDRLLSEPAEFQIDDNFSVTGVGTVVSGTVTAGVITTGETLLLGPNEFGEFVPVTIKSIEAKRRLVKSVRAGHTAAFALKKVKRSAIRKGMRIVHPSLNPRAVVDFEAEILVLYHSTTIACDYEAVVHCGTTRQAAKIIYMDKEFLRTGNKALVIFRFLYSPEYVKAGSRLLFRDGRTKGIGKVTNIFLDGFKPPVKEPGADAPAGAPPPVEEADEAAAEEPAESAAAKAKKKKKMRRDAAAGLVPDDDAEVLQIA